VSGEASERSPGNRVYVRSHLKRERKKQRKREAQGGFALALGASLRPLSQVVITYLVCSDPLPYPPPVLGEGMKEHYTKFSFPLSSPAASICTICTICISCILAG
jgi:hypothetical protein